MRNWLVLGRRCKLRTDASWPPTVRGWTACTPPSPALHDTSATMPPTTMIVPCAFTHTCLLFSSMKNFSLHDTVYISVDHVDLKSIPTFKHIWSVCPLQRQYLIFYKVAPSYEDRLYIVDFGSYGELSSRRSCDNSGTIYSNLCMCGRRQPMLVRLLIWRRVYVFVLALNEDPELDWCVWLATFYKLQCKHEWILTCACRSVLCL